MASDSNLLSVLPFNHLDESSFTLALYGMSHGLMNYEEGHLKLLLCNPIDRPELGNMLSSYLNLDSNFEFHHPCSNYIIEEEVNNQISIANSVNVFSIEQVNARSLHPTSLLTAFRFASPHECFD